MTTYSYIYSLSNNFDGQVKLDQLHQEIENIGITGANFIGITQTSNEIAVIYDNELNIDEQIVLDDAIANHIPDNSPPRNNFINYSPTIAKVQSTSYTKVGSIFLDNSKLEITYIDVVAFKGNNQASYNIRIYDTINDNVIVESTNLTNTESSIINLGNLSNIPSTSTVYEIQAKLSALTGSPASRHVTIDQVLFYYN